MRILMLCLVLLAGCSQPSKMLSEERVMFDRWRYPNSLYRSTLNSINQRTELPSSPLCDVLSDIKIDESLLNNQQLEEPTLISKQLKVRGITCGEVAEERVTVIKDGQISFDLIEKLTEELPKCKSRKLRVSEDTTEEEAREMLRVCKIVQLNQKLKED